MDWKISMTAEPIIPVLTWDYDCNTNGAELQQAIVRGFTEKKDDLVWTTNHESFTFEKTFTFSEHGEFFRGALTMASLSYTDDFYELLKRYGTIKVTIIKYRKDKTKDTEPDSSSKK